MSDMISVNSSVITGFFIVLGYLLIVNSGFVISGVRSYFNRLNKIEKDVKAAHDSIREVRKMFEDINSKLGEIHSESTDRKTWRKV